MPEAQWSIAVRDIDIPHEYDFEHAAGKLADFFSHSHREIDFNTDAKMLFLSYCAYFQIRVAQKREGGDIDGGAQLGACPWKLACSPCHCFCGIFNGIKYRLPR